MLGKHFILMFENLMTWVDKYCNQWCCVVEFIFNLCLLTCCFFFYQDWSRLALHKHFSHMLFTEHNCNMRNWYNFLCNHDLYHDLLVKADNLSCIKHCCRLMHVSGTLVILYQNSEIDLESLMKWKINKSQQLLIQ